MNPLGALQRYAILALVLIVAGGLFGGWQRHQGVKQGRAEGNAKVAALEAQYAQALAKSEANARAKEQASAARVAQIDAYYQQELSDAKHDADRTVADLRAGNLRLRKRWTCPIAGDVPAPGTSAGGGDATPGVRAEDPQRAARDAGVGRLVGYGAEADARIRALQAIIRADRGQP